MKSKFLLVVCIGLMLLWAPWHSRADERESKTIPYTTPQIKEFGEVVRLSDAVHQPRNGAKIVVDVTKGGDSTKINPALVKACRYVNIYAGAGRASANATIAMVLHGDATLAVLSDEAYAKRFSTSHNPNLQCIGELRKAGVQMFVCGQSLIGKGAAVEDVDRDVEVAVSALTSLANLQADDFAYVPLLK